MYMKQIFIYILRYILAIICVYILMMFLHYLSTVLLNCVRACIFACARVFLSSNSIKKTNAGGALCGGRSPTPKRLQCRCGALEWRTSPHGSAPKYMRILCFWFFSLNEKNSRRKRSRSENRYRRPVKSGGFGGLASVKPPDVTNTQITPFSLRASAYLP